MPDPTVTIFAVGTVACGTVIVLTAGIIIYDILRSRRKDDR